jgi:Clostridium P-47 protein
MSTNGASGNIADTYGWDTVFATNFTNANQAITGGWAQVSDKAKNVSQVASDDPSFNLNGVLGPWQLTEGGDGKNVRMLCPFASGTYKAGSNSYNFGGQNVQVIIEVGMEWVPNPGQFSFVISDTTKVDAIKTALDLNQIGTQLSTEFQTHGKPLSSAATALVQRQGKEWLVTDGQTNYYIFHTQDKDNEFLNIYQFQDVWKNNLKMLANEVKSGTDPAVSIISIVNNPATGTIAKGVLSDLLGIWFNDNISEFNHVFSMLDLSPTISQSGKFAWMKPTGTSYAVIDQGTLDTGVFGVLTMAGSHPAANNHQVSEFAIPPGSDAGFLISGPMFLRYMMLEGAKAQFNNAKDSDFLIDNDGLTIKNTRDLIWGKFMMDNKSRGSIGASNYPASLDAGQIPNDLMRHLQTISVFVNNNYSVQVTDKGSQWLLTKGSGDEYILNLKGGNLDVYVATAITIPKGQFQITLTGSVVQIQFIDLAYSASSDFDVHINYTEKVQLGLLLKGGKNIFWYKQILKSMTINVTKTQAALTRAIVEGAITAALALVALAGPIIEGLGAAAEIGDVTEDAGSAILDESSFLKVAADNPLEEAESEAAAGNNAAVQSTGKMTNIKNAFNTPKWKFAGALAALSGVVVGVDQTVSAILENAAKNQWEKVPGFDDFANLAVGPYTWPGVSSFTLQSAGLAGSLQVGLKTNRS